MPGPMSTVPTPRTPPDQGKAAPVAAPADQTPPVTGGSDPTYMQILQAISRMEGTLAATLPAHAAEIAEQRRLLQELETKVTTNTTDMAVVKSDLARAASRPGLWWQAVGAIAGALGTIVAVIAIFVAIKSSSGRG